jgi:hypothetical protein
MRVFGSVSLVSCAIMLGVVGAGAWLVNRALAGGGRRNPALGAPPGKCVASQRARTVLNSPCGARPIGNGLCGNIPIGTGLCGNILETPRETPIATAGAAHCDGAQREAISRAVWRLNSM